MPSRRQTLRHMASLSAAVGLPAIWHTSAQAAQFMDIAQAQKLLLPSATGFTSLALSLDANLLSELAAASQTTVPRGYAPQCWAASASESPAGWVLWDRALGKVELIDYAMGFQPNGVSTGLEVLAYRESHGAEIRNPAWRKQFAGRKGAGQLRFGDDVRNISGATLSCQHVTEAAQRLGVLAQWLAQSKLKA